MNKHLLLSIGRKYLGVLLVVGSLLLIASSNSTGSSAQTSHAGAAVTFLTPKHAFTTVSSPNTDVSTTTNSPPAHDSYVSGTVSPASETPAATPAALSSSPAPSSPSGTPSEVYVPPADDNSDTPTTPSYGCGSCRPTPNKSNPSMMCPQYMSCMY